MQSSSSLNSAEAELTEFLALNPATAWLDALVVDLAGAIRGKRYPVNDLEKLFRAGMQFPVSTYYLDATGACLDPLGKGYSDGDPDACCTPVPGTLKPVPWGPGVGAQVLMAMQHGAAPGCPVEPRWLAAREVARLQEMGFTACCAFEVEFYLLEPENGPGGVPRPLTDGRLGQVYRMDEVEEAQGVLNAIQAACGVQGIPTSVITSEYAAGQFEINLHHRADALEAADHCVLFRRVVRAVARQHQARATFMAKPFPQETGSGMHVHLRLLDDDGANVFDDGSRDGSAVLRHAVGGLLRALPESLALHAPNVNSFRRFDPGTFVPVNASWGHNNRSVAVRIPAGEPAARRLEFRVPGADANPYLTLAAMLAGVRHGLEQRLDPGPPREGNACEDADPDLPLDAAAALARLRGSVLHRDAFGADYMDLYCEARRLEAEKFHAQMDPREYEWYL